MDTRAAHGGEPGALASPRAKAARPEVVGSNPTGPTSLSRLSADVLCTFGVVSVRPDFVGSKREFSPNGSRRYFHWARKRRGPLFVTTNAADEAAKRINCSPSVGYT